MDGKVSIKDSKDLLIFKIDGEFDNLLCLKYKSSIKELIHRKQSKIVIFDLANTKFIDSSGIGLLINRYKQVKMYLGKFVICGVNNSIKKTIAISGIASIVDVYEDIYENIKECVVHTI